VKDGLLPIRTFVIPLGIIDDTIAFLRRVGSGGFEGFVLWSGQTVGRDRFEFRSIMIPEQSAMMTDSGLLVTVEGKALFEVNKAVHERGEILAAQVHSHPTSAYHSSTDDTFPLVTLVGALSVVIPDFARNAPADVEHWAWYRLSKRAEWVPASRNTRVEIE
jgi:hypothetical protein